MGVDLASYKRSKEAGRSRIELDEEGVIVYQESFDVITGESRGIDKGRITLKELNNTLAYHEFVLDSLKALAEDVNKIISEEDKKND